jgi:transcriptional regulator with XRE-family HTH domain
VQQPTVDNQPSAVRMAKGPGALLREAREAAGMTPEALAQRLRLEPRVIEALEAEAFDRLPGPAFTKGYLRSLAKELGIDPAPLLAQYTAQSNEAEPMLADFESRAPAQITTANARIKLVSYALGAVVLILVAIWWQRHYASKVAAPASGDPALASEAVPPPEPSIPLPYTYTIVEHAGAPLKGVLLRFEGFEQRGEMVRLLDDVLDRVRLGQGGAGPPQPLSLLDVVVGRVSG